MKTTFYNPSTIEVTFAKAIQELKKDIEDRIAPLTIKSVVPHKEQDNPDLLFLLTDEDGDEHELVIQFIQRPDK